MEKRYYIETFGCQMNIHDSEKIAGMLQDLGYFEAENKKSSEIIVFNTCCIRETAELKIMSKIGDVKALKKKNKELIVIVCGCMTQQKGMKELLKAKFPFIDIIIGTHNLEELKEYIKIYQLEHKYQGVVWESEGEVKEGIVPFRTSNHNAWVNIMYGCNNFCTYCIVPYVRGRERSRKVEDIVNEVKALVATNRYKTITLLGQNVNSYGKDFRDGKTNFVYLLSKICEIEGDFKVKFMTSHPKDFSQELIDFISQNKKMSHAIHLPVQSGSDRVLKLMNRYYDVQHYKDLVTSIYQKIPDANLTTDIIVGFPSESEEDFEKTLELLDFCHYAGVFGFVYSKRKGTPAEKFEEQIDDKTKQNRITRLFDKQHEIQKQDLPKFVGKDIETIAECVSGKITLKTDSGKTIAVDDIDLEDGKTYNVKILEIVDGELKGEVIKK